MAKKLKSDEVEDGRTSVCLYCREPLAMIEGQIRHANGTAYEKCVEALTAKALDSMAGGLKNRDAE